MDKVIGYKIILKGIVYHETSLWYIFYLQPYHYKTIGKYYFKSIMDTKHQVLQDGLILSSTN